MSFNFLPFLFTLNLSLGLFFFFKLISLFYLLIISEISWITLYLNSLLTAIVLDNFSSLSLSFFFLMFSAAEISTGLSIFLLQNNFNNSLKLTHTDSSKSLFLH